MGPWGRYPLMLNYARGAGPRKPGYMATVINLLYEARARANTRAHARTRFLARACALAPSLPHSLSLTLARSTRSLALALSPSLTCHLRSRWLSHLSGQPERPLARTFVI